MNRAPFGPLNDCPRRPDRRGAGGRGPAGRRPDRGVHMSGGVGFPRSPAGPAGQGRLRRGGGSPCSSTTHGAAVQKKGRLLRRPGHPRRRGRPPRAWASRIMSWTTKSRFRDQVIGGSVADAYLRGETPVPLQSDLQPDGEVHADLLDTSPRPGRGGHQVHRPLCCAVAGGEQKGTGAAPWPSIRPGT